MIGFGFLTMCGKIEFLYLGALRYFSIQYREESFGGGKICSFDNRSRQKYLVYFHIKHGKLVHSHVSDFSHIWHFFTHWKRRRSHCCWGRKRTTAVSRPPGRPPWLPPELQGIAHTFYTGAFACCFRLYVGSQLSTSKMADSQREEFQPKT